MGREGWHYGDAIAQKKWLFKDLILPSIMHYLLLQEIFPVASFVSCNIYSNNDIFVSTTNKTTQEFATYKLFKPIKLRNQACSYKKNTKNTRKLKKFAYLKWKGKNCFITCNLLDINIFCKTSFGQACHWSIFFAAGRYTYFL